MQSKKPPGPLGYQCLHTRWSLSAKVGILDTDSTSRDASKRLVGASLGGGGGLVGGGGGRGRIGFGGSDGPVAG